MKKCDYFMDLIITDYIDDRIDKTSLDKLENHLMDCHDCRLFLKEVKDSAVSPFKVSAQPTVPVELWNTIKQKIEYEKDGRSRLEDFFEKIRGLIIFPRLVPILASLILMLLAGSVTISTIQVEQNKSKDQGEYLVSLLSPATAGITPENNDLGTPIEHYFL